MNCKRYSPFLYDGIIFSNHGGRVGDRSCRHIHREAPELARLFRNTNFCVVEKENSIHLKVEIPGIKGADLLVRIDAGVLRIQGSRMLKSGESNKKFKFSKNFLMDDSLDITQLKARLQRGLLTVEFQKKEKETYASLELTECAVKNSNPVSSDASNSVQASREQETQVQDS